MNKGNGSSPYLTRDQILSSDDLTYEEVDIPNWKGKVRIREMTAMERNKLGAEFSKGGASIPPDFYPKIAAMVIVDQNGKRIFSDKDAAMLGEKSFAAVQLAVDTSLRLSGMTEEAAKEAGKESEIQTEDSPSA